MLAAPPPLSDRDEVMLLWRRWHAESPGTRRAPGSVEIRQLVATPIHRIAITRIGENRGVQVVPQQPAARATPGSQPPIDAWGIPELDLDPHSPVGHRAQKVLEELPARVADCERCRGSGKNNCPTCHGSGVRGHGKHRHVCAACSGKGSRPCVPCDGLGGFRGPPLAWSAIVEGTVSRIVRAPGVSDEAALDVDAALARGLGTVIVRDDAWGGGLSTGVGYRDAAHATQLADEVQSLFAELEATSLGRVRSHRLEIRRAAVYAVTLEDGTSFSLWGPPAKVSPEDALDVRGAALTRTIALVLVGVLLGLGLLWMQSHH